MKKQFIIFMSIGVLLLIIGSVGSAVLFKKIESDVRVVVHEKKAPTNKKNLDTVNLTIEGDSEFIVMPSEDNQFHLENTFYNVHQQKNLKWQVSEKEKETNISVQLEQTDNNRSLFTFGFWYDWAPTEIHIPKGVKTLNLTSKKQGFVQFQSIELDTLQTSVHGNLRIDHLTAKNIKQNEADGNFEIQNSQISDTIDLQSKSSSLILSNSSFKKLKATTNNGQIHLDTLVGDVAAKNDSGETYINQIHGETTIEHRGGLIEWNATNKVYPMTLSTDYGDIVANIQNANKKLSLTTKTKEGNIYLDRKEKDKLSIGKGDPQVSLHSVSGRIQVYQNTYFEYDDYDDNLIEEDML